MKNTVDKSSPKSSGFSMIEVVIVIAVISILAGLIMPLAVNTIKQGRVKACWEEIQIIKKAIVGDPALVEGGSRNSFGFVGDLGVLPQPQPPPQQYLQELITQGGSRPVYQEYLLPPANTSTGMFYGWRGPYVSEAVDPWGRDYRYEIRAATPADKTIAYIWSCGPDGVTDIDPTSTNAPNADNIKISISQDEAFSMISGNTLDSCGAGSACTVSISTPDGTGVIFTTAPALITSDALPIYNTGYILYDPTAPPMLYPIGVRRVVFSKGGIDYAFLLTINNGPITLCNFREPGACPN